MLHMSGSFSSWRGVAAEALLASVLAAVTAAPALAAGPFTSFSGAWSGGGHITLEGGETERLQCRAYYSPRGDGASLALALRCASASNKIELRASLSAAGGRISGDWEERNFNATGTVTGSASGDRIKLSINGGSFSGSMAVTTEGATQTVSIATQGIALKGLSIQLRRSN
jgi:hypothetical protein